MKTESGILLTFDEAKALREALENYMCMYSSKLTSVYPEYKKLWNDADKALVPLRGGPMSPQNRSGDWPAPDPLKDI